MTKLFLYGIRWLLPLILIVGCSTPSDPTLHTPVRTVPIVVLDNLSVMGRYVRNNTVFMSVNAISRNQVSIKVNGGKCNFSGVGTLSNNRTVAQGKERLTLTFFQQNVKVESSAQRSNCAGIYVKR